MQSTIKFKQLINQLNIGNPNQSIDGEVRPLQRRPNLIDSDEELFRTPPHLLSLSPGLDDVPNYIGNYVSFILLQN